MLDQTNAHHQMYNPVPANPQHTVVSVVPSRELQGDDELKMDRRRQQLAACSKRNRLKKKEELENLQSKLASLSSALSQETEKLRKELGEKDAELNMLKSELAIEKICHSEARSEDSIHPRSFAATESSSSVLGKRSREEVLTDELKKRDKFIGALMQLANSMPVNPFKQMNLDIIPTESHLGDSPNPFLRDQFFKVLSGSTTPQVPDKNELCSSTLPAAPIHIANPPVVVVPSVHQSSARVADASNHDASELSDVLLELESGLSDANDDSDNESDAKSSAIYP